jgi:cytochrome bd-type quinol oxidase subunit 2
MSAAVETQQARRPHRWFACFLYALTGVAAFILAVMAGGVDSVLAHSSSWRDMSNPPAPLAYVPVTALWAVAGAAFFVAAVLTLRRPRAALVVAVVAWVAGLAAPLLLPLWQAARQLQAWDPPSLPFAAVWLVLLVPLVIAAAYALLFARRQVHGASA